MNTLGETISTLRKQAGLTNLELAEIARVSHSLIPGLQSGKRTIGEFQARKIGVALGLSGSQLEDFIFLAINRCTKKVLREAMGYPAELLNLLATQLRAANILPGQIRQCTVQTIDRKAEAAITTDDGTQLRLTTTLVPTS